MRHHIGRVRSREDRGSEEVNAVYSKRLWWKQLVYPGDQEYGTGDESSARIFWERQNFEKQQLVSLW